VFKANTLAELTGAIANQNASTVADFSDSAVLSGIEVNASHPHVNLGHVNLGEKKRSSALLAPEH